MLDFEICILHYFFRMLLLAIFLPKPVDKLVED